MLSQRLPIYLAASILNLIFSISLFWNRHNICRTLYVTSVISFYRTCVNKSSKYTLLLYQSLFHDTVWKMYKSTGNRLWHSKNEKRTFRYVREGFDDRSQGKRKTFVINCGQLVIWTLLVLILAHAARRQLQ